MPVVEHLGGPMKGWGILKTECELYTLFAATFIRSAANLIARTMWT
jgi:hypothetical protein